MAVVDSSALIHLSRINKLSLLKEFFGKIKIIFRILESRISIYSYTYPAAIESEKNTGCCEAGEQVSL